MRFKLRSLQKGFARIALTVQEENNWKLPLYIVPVGIQYDHYYNFRSRVLISYGQPIPVDQSLRGLSEREFYDTVLEKTRKGLLPLMLHIEDENYQDVEAYLRQHRDQQDLVEQLKHDQVIVANWDGTLAGQSQPRKNNLLLIAGLPLHIYAWVNNFLPYFLTSWLLKKYVNLEFKGSLKVGFGMVIVPFFYLLQSAAIQLVFHDWRVTLGYLITLPFLSVWSVDLFKSARGTLL
jgi:hypothetical protein